MEQSINHAKRKKVALVTGASGGIGEAIAIRLVEAGWQVAVHYQHQQVKAQAVASALNAIAEGSAEIFRADIASEVEVVNLVSEVINVFGHIDGLVNNAGIITPVGTLRDVTQARLERLFAVNITGSLLCAKAVLEHMGEGAAIVNMSSAAARLGSANQFIDYAASKGAIDTFTIGLAQEVAPLGIRVNAVRPGLIATELHAKAGDAERTERLKHSIPMQRVGEAREVAEAVCWLLSDAASYVTGSIIDVAGGR